MSVMELLTTRRTYRRFAQKAVPQDVVNDIVQAVRLSSCGANRQAVRLVLVQSPEMVAKVQPLVKWAGYLPPEQGTPKADELPTFYAAVVQDTAIPGDLATDTGIALANMTLAAWDKGVGSCIMGVYGGFRLPHPQSQHRTHDRADRRKVLSGRKPRLLRAQAQRRGDRKKPVKAGLYCIYSHVFSVIA